MQLTLNQLLKYTDRLGKEINSGQNIQASSINFPVTSVTTEAEFDDYKKKLKTERQKYEDKIKEKMIKFDVYIKLKNLILETNIKIGLNKLMIEQTMLSQRSRILTLIINQNERMITLNSELLTLTHYQSMVSEAERVKVVSQYVIDREYLDTIIKEVEILDKLRITVSDKIALLNQTTIVEVDDEIMALI